MKWVDDNVEDDEKDRFRGVDVVKTYERGVTGEEDVMAWEG